MTYLDHNASTPMTTAAKRAVFDAMALEGNATSPHAHGRAASRVVGDSRQAVALAFGVCASDLYFTASGTEADNQVIISAVEGGSRRLLVSSMDHPATIEAALHSGAEVEFIPASPNGVTDMDWLAERLSRWSDADGRPFVSMVAANSECGVVQPVERAYELVREADGLLLVDAVQVPGKIDLPIIADYITWSAHKLGGPKGVGALYADPSAPLHPLVRGGGQERRKRAGTLNVAGIAGFGAAAAEARPFADTIKIARDTLEQRLAALDPDVVFLGQGAPRLPNTLLFGLPGVSGQTLMMGLDLEGVSVSTGTACSSGSVRLSRAVQAMGHGETLAKGVVRVSFGATSQLSDVEAFLSAWAKVRRLSPKSSKEMAA